MDPRHLRPIVSPVILLLAIAGLQAVLPFVSIRRYAAVPPPVLAALDWAGRAAFLAALAWLFLRIGRFVEAALTSLSARSGNAWDDVMLPLAGRAVRILLPLVALIFGAPTLAASPAVAALFERGTSLLLIAVVAFLLFQAVDGAAAMILRPHRLDLRDNLQARTVHTQVVVLKKVAKTAIGLFTLASMLMVFEPVRQFGASILASAGIAGLVVGFAAQRSLSALVAGFQIALTQPIRVDDVVIVENEWGRIEDITLTYVVVRIWDLRRLILPITYFIEQPFENWTRASADLLGTVFLHVDYSVPLEALRAELSRILAASPLWDGRVNVLQVTDAKEHSVQIRALTSAADASQAWDLRCEVREKLIAFLQQHYPESLPRVRATLDGPMFGTA